MEEYSAAQVWLHNLPYILMGLLSAAVLAAGWNLTPAGWLAAAGYALYTLLGALWIMLFVCPYCAYYATRSCPCGYGTVAARLRPRARENRFAEKFRRHIPVIVPLWIIPAVAGVIFLARDFRPWLLALLVLFALDAFVALPLLSRGTGCARCPQKEDCPWMGNRKKAAVPPAPASKS
jgi:hypothetical protein